MEAFKNIAGYEYFMLGSHKVLINTIQNFLSVKANLHITHASNLFKKFNVDVNRNPKQNTYFLQDGKVVLISTVELEGITYFLGIILNGENLRTIKDNGILNCLAASISKALESAVSKKFRNSVIIFNDNLIESLIGRYLGLRGNMNQHLIRYVINVFKNLKNTTFEGKSFSSGFIVTKSLHEYEKGFRQNGEILDIGQGISIYEPIDKRIWYLVDGVSSFYISDFKHDICKIYFTHENKSELQMMMPLGFMKGADIVYKVYNGKELSLLVKGNTEFVFSEGYWKLRDYNGIKELINSYLGLEDNIYDAIMSYVLYCSKNEISSIIWLPSELNSDDFTNRINIYNQISENSNINVTEEGYSALFHRVLSSDGASVISKDGNLRFYGCIIKMHNIKKGKGLKGTGETAVQSLAGNGIAIKISQDGTIKMYLDSNSLIRI